MICINVTFTPIQVAPPNLQNVYYRCKFQVVQVNSIHNVPTIQMHRSISCLVAIIYNLCPTWMYLFILKNFLILQVQSTFQSINKLLLQIFKNVLTFLCLFEFHTLTSQLSQKYGYLRESFYKLLLNLELEVLISQRNLL